MKRFAFFLTLAAVSASAYFASRRTEPPPAEVDPTGLYEGVMSIDANQTDVFQRALWRRPAPDDKILHAERREWTNNNAEGVAHWQWFLAVESGPALKKWLREGNPFSLHPAGDAAVPVIRGAPGWFPSDLSGYEIRTGGSRGSLVFLFSSQDDTLFATDSGAGFTPGALAPARPAPESQTVSRGRLSPSPPPISTKP